MKNATFTAKQSVSGKIKYLCIPMKRWSCVSTQFSGAESTPATNVAASMIVNIIYDNPTEKQYLDMIAEIKAARKTATTVTAE